MLICFTFATICRTKVVQTHASLDEEFDSSSITSSFSYVRSGTRRIHSSYPNMQQHCSTIVGEDGI